MTATKATALANMHALLQSRQLVVAVQVVPSEYGPLGSGEGSGKVRLLAAAVRCIGLLEAYEVGAVVF